MFSKEIISAISQMTNSKYMCGHLDLHRDYVMHSPWNLYKNCWIKKLALPHWLNDSIWFRITRGGNVFVPNFCQFKYKSLLNFSNFSLMEIELEWFSGFKLVVKYNCSIFLSWIDCWILILNCLSRWRSCPCLRLIAG